MEIKVLAVVLLSAVAASVVDSDESGYFCLFPNYFSIDAIVTYPDNEGNMKATVYHIQLDNINRREKLSEQGSDEGKYTIIDFDSQTYYYFETGKDCTTEVYSELNYFAGISKNFHFEGADTLKDGTEVKKYSIDFKDKNADATTRNIIGVDKECKPKTEVARYNISGTWTELYSIQYTNYKVTSEIELDTDSCK